MNSIFSDQGTQPEIEFPIFPISRIGSDSGSGCKKVGERCTRAAECCWVDCSNLGGPCRFCYVVCNWSTEHQEHHIQTLAQKVPRWGINSMMFWSNKIYCGIFDPKYNSNVLKGSVLHIICELVTHYIDLHRIRFLFGNSFLFGISFSPSGILLRKAMMHQQLQMMRS